MGLLWAQSHLHLNEKPHPPAPSGLSPGLCPGRRVAGVGPRVLVPRHDTACVCLPDISFLFIRPLEKVVSEMALTCSGAKKKQLRELWQTK